MGHLVGHLELLSWAPMDLIWTLGSFLNPLYQHVNSSWSKITRRQCELQHYLSVHWQWKPHMHWLVVCVETVCRYCSSSSEKLSCWSRPSVPLVPLGWFPAWECVRWAGGGWGRGQRGSGHGRVERCRNSQLASWWYNFCRVSVGEAYSTLFLLGDVLG